MGRYRTGERDPQGSVWRRWEPHIHPPGTLFNDQYPAGDDGWDKYLKLFEDADPAVTAVGVTDYFGLWTYEALLERAKGRIPGVTLVFPNVELRLNISTQKGPSINLHLLVSPDDPEHVAKTNQFLKGLTFEAFDTTFHCDPDDLRRLGRRYNPAQTDDQAALADGANQFKADFKQLRTAWRQNAWIQENALIAVAGSNRDGTAGLGGDPALDTLRAEIESFAHVIFASTPRQRLFWLGKDGVSVDDLEARYNGRKPCLHGSDAHGLQKVLNPDLDRRCWIKGDAVFESLRQAALEPEDRVFIGAEPPNGALPSQVMTGLEVRDADWLPSAALPLNGGLICVIGARGSGKTALADLVAAGAYASQPNEQSFLHRARPRLKNEVAALSWLDGGSTSNSLSMTDFEELFDVARVQYLSQQFVDRLCAADGVTSELMSEIHRVIYQAHAPDDRLGATDFDELLDAKAARARASHERHAETLDALSNEIEQEREKHAALAGLRVQRENLLGSATRQKTDRAALITQGDAERAAALDAISRAVEARAQVLESQERRRNAVLALKEEVAAFRIVAAASQLRQLRVKHSEAALSDPEWNRFKLDYSGDVDGAIRLALSQAEAEITALRGAAPVGTGPHVQPGADMSKLTLAVLRAEQTRLQALVGVDRERAKRYDTLTQRIIADEAAAAKVEREITQAEGAQDRINTLLEDRKAAYRGVFAALIEEQAQLGDLYAPLGARLEGEQGALAKLAFVVRRAADVQTWADAGEELLDVRKQGAFRGRGALATAAALALKEVWETGTAEGVAEAMVTFLQTHRQDFLDQANVDRADKAAFRKWVASLMRWLYGVGHIRVAYSVQYDTTDIEQLSPGTRGIVLLLLYLAIDREDLRPLIIDQPEENLDPKSIFDELVPRFRSAKTRRQVLIVTHNANLVVNTDADQVIVATCQPRQGAVLPEIRYVSGGLENPAIRQSVCEILEGGEAAFKERARRLRVRIPREPEVAATD